MRILALLIALLLTGTGTASAAEPAKAEDYMAATANPLATEAALRVLRDGGSAVDAAIAVQMVLTLVEPQSSGIGGGGFMLHFDADTKKLIAYDGRETAPASAHPDMFLRADGSYMGWHEAVVGGLSVGVPGVVRMLEMAHSDNGNLPWERLFEDAIRLAREGFPVTPRMHMLAINDDQLRVFDETRRYFFDLDGNAHPVGTVLTNEALADTLTLIAEGGADAFYEGPIAAAIANTVSFAPRNPTSMTRSDIAVYEAKRREPVCLDYRDHTVCGMPPPSSGGITTLQILGMLEPFDMSRLDPGQPGALHVIAEASRLAFADRNTYLGDPDHVRPPDGLLDESYLRRRSDLIDAYRAMGKAEPGNPGSEAFWPFAPAGNEHGVSTTHFSIVDGDGNVVSMTSSIETQFGSRLMVRGFLLNNQLTDFNWLPEVDGKPVANQAGPGRRPRSSMSPTIVFDDDGDFELAIGSPGGSSIIGYVTKSLIGYLDWDLNVQDAIDLAHVINKNGATLLENDRYDAWVLEALRDLGHDIEIREMTSGLQGIAAAGDDYEGGADPRREGVAAGD